MLIIQMSLAGTALILLVAFIRAVTLRAVPKRTFMLLWLIVAIRLLVPFRPFIQIDYPFASWLNDSRIAAIENSVQSFSDREKASRSQTVSGTGAAAEQDGETYAAQDGGTYAAQSADADVGAEPDVSGSSAGSGVRAARAFRLTPETILILLWATGFAALGGFFVLSYVLGYRKFRIAEKVQNDQAESWLQEHRLTRPIQIRALKGISSPMTYGVLSPVILVPAQKDWWRDNETKYSLEHEFVHICRFDAALKFLLTIVLTIHWFNPAVWLFYVLVNRDVELSCDETVLRRFGIRERSGYARALLSAEADRGELPALYASFGTNSTKQRILHIIKYRKNNPFRVIFAAILVLFTTLCLLLSACTPRRDVPAAASDNGALEKLMADEDAARLALAGDWVCLTENGQIYLSIGSDGSAYGYNNGKKLNYGNWNFKFDGTGSYLVMDWGGILKVESFGDGFALVNGNNNNSRPYHTLIKAEDYQSFLDRYCTVVDLSEVDPAEYFGVGAPIEYKFSYNNFGKTKTRTFYSLPSAALDNGLVYLSCSGDVELTFSDGQKRTVSNPYLPTDLSINGANVVEATGKIVFISAEYVRSVAYSEDGNWRIITMTDGTEIYGFDNLGNIIIGGQTFNSFKFAAEAGLQF